MGTDALFEIYVFGKYSDIMSDHDTWEVFSPYLLLVDEDFIHYTYINDDGEVMESQVSCWRRKGVNTYEQRIIDRKTPGLG